MNRKNNVDIYPNYSCCSPLAFSCCAIASEAILSRNLASSLAIFSIPSSSSSSFNYRPDWYVIQQSVKTTETRLPPKVNCRRRYLLKHFLQHRGQSTGDKLPLLDAKVSLMCHSCRSGDHLHGSIPSTPSCDRHHSRSSFLIVFD